MFGLQCESIESQRLEPGTDLHGAMEAAIERLGSEGWYTERQSRDSALRSFGTMATGGC